MSMAAHPSREEIVGGINSSEDALKSGPNQNCRVYSVEDNKYVYPLSPFTPDPQTRILGSHFRRPGVRYI